MFRRCLHSYRSSDYVLRRKAEAFQNPGDAVAAAVEMNAALGEFNRAHGTTLEFGIGMDSGMLSLGMIGEEQRVEGTVISDIVNTASRLEGLTRELGHRILFSENTANQLEGAANARFLKTVTVKGRVKPVRVHTIASTQSPETIHCTKSRTAAELLLPPSRFLRAELERVAPSRRCLQFGQHPLQPFRVPFRIH